MGSPSYNKSHHTYYIVIDCIPYTVHFLSMNNLFCNWKFVPLNLPHLFIFSLQPAFPLATTCFVLWSVTLLRFCYICLFCFLESTYKWNHSDTVFIFLQQYNTICIHPHYHKLQDFTCFFMAEYGQGGLACCNSWGRKESDTTWATELNWIPHFIYMYIHIYINMSHLPYPFVYWWSLGLLLYFG